ncbi:MULTISPECIES: hypothetical protein [unclassified Pseudomonas]|uniref:hypothetical protein n=1 Tax=unclassified Pseudomonas TaxID=196821 RepID=UPI0021BB724B|nr:MULTISPECIES: hypothetical protein [unclassified Pseudomonas]MCT8165628.1 hypothetical protein [Pseudomonas sp. HD6422]MCT8183622.1 hypothetical protein [Pseudomonas sp. HD6421]
MPKTAQERATLLRQAASDGRRNPDDIFDARMTIHDAFEGTGADSNRLCELLISLSPPLTEWDCNRLEMVASLIESEPAAQGDHLFRLCEMAKLVAPW